VAEGIPELRVKDLTVSWAVAAVAVPTIRGKRDDIPRKKTTNRITASVIRLFFLINLI
jgi:hypothetical protein